MIISIMNPKGGAGKTTMSTIIADGLNRRHGDVVLVDTDPQQSALKFYSGSDFMVQAIALAGIETALATLREKFSYVVVDTPSGSGRDHTLPRVKVIKASDLVLIPVQPSPYDFAEAGKVIELLEEQWTYTPDKPKARFLLNGIKSGTALSKAAKEELRASAQVPLFPRAMRDLEIHRQSVSEGKTIFSHSRYRGEGESFLDALEEILDQC